MAEATRTEILRAADQLFGELGFDGASIRGIADASGVNKALIHYHFRSKDELFGAVLERYYEELDGVLESELSRDGAPLERLMRALDAYVDFLADNQSFSRIIQREASGGRHFDRIVARTLPMFQRGVEMLHTAYPVTKSGELAASQLLLSFHGMVIGTFSYGPVIEKLTGSDPLSKKNLERRKQHLRRMVALVARELGERNET